MLCNAYIALNFGSNSRENRVGDKSIAYDIKIDFKGDNRVVCKDKRKVR